MGFAIAAGLAGAFAFWLWTGRQPPLGAPQARAGDCVEIGLWSNDWHASLAFQAAILPPDHPLRRLEPQARYFLFGWGDSAFYQSDGRDLWLGLKALAPGGPVIAHVIGATRPVESFYPPSELVALGVSRAGAAALAARLAETLQLDGDGTAQIVAPGHAGAHSYFLAARGEFNLFQVCNQWVARTLRTAGIDVDAALPYRASWLAKDARAQAPACAVAKLEDINPESRHDS
jgi:hypothetical protein